MTRLELAPAPLPETGQEDSAILEGFRARKPLQCRHVYALVMSALEQYFRWGLCPALGRDALQDVAHSILMRLLTTKALFEGRSSASLKTWIWTIARNELINLLRGERVARAWVHHGPTQPDEDPTADRTHDCLRALERIAANLSPAQRQALGLASNRTNEESANELGTSVEAFKSTLAHARRKAKEDPLLVELRSSRAGAGTAKNQGESK